MKDIRMVDLDGQYKKIKPDIDQAIEKTISQTAFINGPEVKHFRQALEQYLNVSHVIPCANGTDALQIALMSLGLERGDEVITTNFTFASTVEVILLLGYTPILVDIDSDTYNIDPNAVLKAITPKTKAIIPVHLFGQGADMQKLLEISKSHNLRIIEDNAQSIGAEYLLANNKNVKLGTIGDIGTTSFFPSKNLGCFGDGGALFTNNDEIAERARIIANHGMSKRYFHDVVGLNSRLDTIQAAVLNQKLKYLDDYNTSRYQSAKYYTKLLKPVKQLLTPFEYEKSTHVYHQYTIRVFEKRDELAAYLMSQNIPIGIYYPVPLHQQEAYLSNRNSNHTFDVTNEATKQVLSLPMHTELDTTQMDYIVKHIKLFFDQNKR